FLWLDHDKRKFQPPKLAPISGPKKRKNRNHRKTNKKHTYTRKVTTLLQLYNRTPLALLFLAVAVALLVFAMPVLCAPPGPQTPPPASTAALAAAATAASAIALASSTAMSPGI